MLALPNFELFFKVKYDTSRVRIVTVLTQAKHPLTYFNMKLNGSRLNYYAYYKEFYAIVKALEHWNHYLKPKPFIRHSDHEALPYISGQHKLNTRHAKWPEFF